LRVEYIVRVRRAPARSQLVLGVQVYVPSVMSLWMCGRKVRSELESRWWQCIAMYVVESVRHQRFWAVIQVAKDEPHSMEE
jgi:hypothetical protein